MNIGATPGPPARQHNLGRQWGMCLLMAAAFCGTAADVPAAPENVALGQPVVASAEPSPGFPAAKVVDGDSATYWASAPGPINWVYVDLGAAHDISRVVADWNQYNPSKAYQFQTSDDAATWTTVYTDPDGAVGFEINDVTLSPSVEGRYLRMYSTSSGPVTWAIRMDELEVWGTSDPDRDGDGMPNDWEVANGLDPDDDGSTDPDQGADGNKDGDPQKNYEEYLADTAANDPLAYFRIVSQSIDTDGVATVSIPASSLRSFSLYASNDLGTGGIWRLASGPAPGNGSALAMQASDRQRGGIRFTRARATLPGVAAPPTLPPSILLGKTATASSYLGGQPQSSAAMAIDGDPMTAWTSDEIDGPDDWVQIDMAGTYLIDRIVLDWSPFYPASFEVRVSMNGATWTDIYADYFFTGGWLDTPIAGPVEGRFLRVRSLGTADPGWKLSLYEVEAYGSLISGTIDNPPTVDAGDDRTVSLTGGQVIISLSGSVIDDLTIPTSTWSHVSGSGTVIFGDASQPVTLATFTAVGTNVLELSADDGLNLPVTDQVTIIVLEEGSGPSAGSPNLAYLKPVTVNGENPSWPAVLAVDGVHLTYWRSLAPPTYSPNPWLVVDLGEVYDNIDRVNLQYFIGSTSYAALNYDIDYSLDGVNWFLARNEPAGELTMREDVLFAPLSARYIRYYVNTLVTFNQGVTLDEIQVYQTRALQELQQRDEAPNFFKKLQDGGQVRVAYIGGSITAIAGWRPLSETRIEGMFPGADVIQINSTLGGTGTKEALDRLQSSVIDQHPDFVFIEFVVNDSHNPYEENVMHMEQIVRRLWQADPTVDICFVYTLEESATQKDVEALSQGYYQVTGAAFEEVADHYGIPTIHLGKDIADKAAAGQVIMVAPSISVGGIPVYSNDGVHPYVGTGHTWFVDAIERSFNVMKTNVTPMTHTMPDPIMPRQ